MVTIFDVDPFDLIMRVKEELKKFPQIKPPYWAKFVKTGCHKQRPPEQKDWWYIRAAAILRYLYKVGKPIGVERLRKKYGGAKLMGHRPPKHVKGSGSIIRKILQQLEAAGLVKKVDKPRPGRVITPEGKSLLDKIATQIYEEKYGTKQLQSVEVGKGVEIRSEKYKKELEELAKKLKSVTKQEK